MKFFFKKWANRFLVLSFVCLILLAVVVQLGREAFPLINDYYKQISVLLSERLDADIYVGDVNASWNGLTPKLVLSNVVVRKNDQLVLETKQASAEISLLASLLEWRVAWQNISFVDLESTLIQAQNGEWHFQGLEAPSKNNQKFVINDPLDIFLFGRRIDISNILLNVKFRTGKTTQIELPELQLENDRNFHRLTASIDIDEDRAFKVIVEGVGDPRDKEAFQAKGFLSLNQFPMEKVSAALGLDSSLLFDNDSTTFSDISAEGDSSNSDDNLWGEGHRMDLSLWFEGNLTRSFNFEGTLSAGGLPFVLSDNSNLPDSVQSHIVGGWDVDEGFELLFKQLSVQYRQFKAPLINVLFYRNTQGEVGVKTPSFDVGAWSEFAQALNAYEDLGLAGKALTTLQPYGLLNYLDVKLKSKEEGFFELTAQAIGAGVNAWQGVPEIKNANGFVKASALRGFINVDNREPFSLHLPVVYNEPLKFNSGKGQVVWDVDLKRKYVSIYSGLTKLEAENESAAGYFYLDLPFKKNIGEGQMILLIGLDKSIAQSHKRYVPKLIPNTLYQWFDSSIQSGDLSDIAFMYHGSIRAKPKIKPAIQIQGDIKNATLAFSPDWPALKDIDAHLAVDDNNVSIAVDNATIKNNEIKQARIDLVKIDGARALQIKGAVDSDVKKAMSLLQESPIRKQMGSAFDSWKISGDMTAAVNLLIPIDKKGGRGYQRIDLKFNKSDIVIPESKFTLKDINGSITFDSNAGFSSKNLKASVWGKPIKAAISSEIIRLKNASRVLKSTRIDFSGDLEASDLFNWSARPDIKVVTGKSQVKGYIAVPLQKSSLEKLTIAFESNLKGARIDLPPPLNKSSDQTIDFSAKIEFDKNEINYDFNLKNIASMKLQQANKGLRAASVRFGDGKAKLSRGVFDISGALDQIDIRRWNEVKAEYFSYAGRSLDKKPNSKAAVNLGLPIKLNVDVNHFYLGDFNIQKLNVTGTGNEKNWDLTVSSEIIKGNVRFNQRADLAQINLDYLRLPANDSSDFPQQEQSLKNDGLDNTVEVLSQKRESVMRKIDISQASIIPTQLYIADFSIGYKRYGKWRFNINPIDNGIEVTNILGNVRKLSVGSRSMQTDPSSEPKPIGASLSWTNINDVNYTTFKGGITANNIANVLAAWDQPRMVTSETISVDMDMKWLGAPDDISLTALEGTAKLNMNNGTFIRGAKAGENPLLRLIGLFNFDTFARRIRLDFSDLSKRGYVYDTLEGNFELSKGVLALKTPIVVNSSTSKMQLGGEIDLARETVDGQLVVTLPVGGNLTVAAAFSAGLPAALGVYVVSRLFKKQVDKVSSINYSVTGKWAEPKIKVRQIFNDTAAEIKSEALINEDKNRKQDK